MKRKILNSTGILALTILFFSACTKEKDTPKETTSSTSAAGPVGGFTWTPAGGSAVVASDAYFIPAYNNIVANKNTTSDYVDIILDTLSVGNHTISPSLGITLEFGTSTATYTGKSGSVNITAKTGTLMSGTFTSALNGGTITSISGQFTNIPQK
jgi:hypothetical protein